MSSSVPIDQGVRLEVCVETPAGAQAALRAGADRIELCSWLPAGGVTPSPGAVAITRETVPAGRLMVLVRPRPGDFVYDAVERRVIEEDIRWLKDRGVDGLVVGALTPDGDVDEPFLERLVRLARPLSVTFHRAFDQVRDPLRALETLRRHAVDRVLTAGQSSSAPAGAGRLAELADASGGSPIVVAGGGIRESDVRDLVARTGVTEIHVSAAVLAAGHARFRNELCDPASSGPKPTPLQHVVTSEERVRRYLVELGRLGSEERAPPQDRRSTFR